MKHLKIILALQQFQKKMFYICKPLLAERQTFSPECEIIYNLNISNRIEFKSVKDIEYHSV